MGLHKNQELRAGGTRITPVLPLITPCSHPITQPYYTDHTPIRVPPARIAEMPPRYPPTGAIAPLSAVTSKRATSGAPHSHTTRTDITQSVPHADASHRIATQPASSEQHAVLQCDSTSPHATNHDKTTSHANPAWQQCAGGTRFSSNPRLRSGSDGRGATPESRTACRRYAYHTMESHIIKAGRVALTHPAMCIIFSC